MSKKIIRTALISSILGFVSAIPALGQISNHAGEVWRPVEVDGRQVTVTNAFISIEPGQRQFTGDTDCNLMRGTFVLSGHGRIAIKSVITTKRACKMMEGSVPERTFLNALNVSVRYSRRGKNLDLFDKRGHRLIRFKASPKAETSGDTGASAIGLDDQKWFLESIDDRKTLVAITGIFVNFVAEKGSAGGDTGCNVFGGSYKAGKRDIRIFDIISTMRACEEDGKMQLEREFLDGLQNATRYEIKDGHLFLYRKNELLLTLRGEPKS